MVNMNMEPGAGLGRNSELHFGHNCLLGMFPNHFSSIEAIHTQPQQITYFKLNPPFTLLITRKFTFCNSDKYILHFVQIHLCGSASRSLAWQEVVTGTHFGREEAFRPDIIPASSPLTGFQKLLQTVSSQSDTYFLIDIWQILCTCLYAV